VDDGRYGGLNEAQQYAIRKALDGEPLVAVLDREVRSGELTRRQAAEAAEVLDAGAATRWRS
jgi:hypothetical protein